MDLQSLVTGIIVSPFAQAGALQETEDLIRNAGYSLPVTPSAVTSGASLLPTESDLRRYS